MRFLVDTNVLLRGAQPADPLHDVTLDALDALDALRARGEALCLVPQNLIEFWSVATRPMAQNGLAKTVEQAQSELARLRTLFVFLEDPPTIYDEWERLVTNNKVLGKKAHDARLVAAMNVHGITNILTFNTDDFKRFERIRAIDPRAVPSPDGEFE